MADKTATPDIESDAPAAPSTSAPPKRGPGHRGAEVKDTVAEMAAKAHEISLEAGSRMAAAMKDVINAAAGITGFVVESARDLVQYMVRRGQMTQEEADKLIKQAEEAQIGRPAPKPPEPAAKAKAAAESAKPPKAQTPSEPVSVTDEDDLPDVIAEEDEEKATAKTAAKTTSKAATKTAAKSPAKAADESRDEPAEKEATTKKAAAKKTATKTAEKATAKTATKSAAKTAATKTADKAKASAKKATTKKK